MAEVSQSLKDNSKRPPCIAYGSGPMAQYQAEMELAHKKTHGFEPKVIASIQWSSEVKLLFSPQEIWKYGKPFCKDVIHLIAYRNDANCAQLATEIFNHYVLHGGPAALITLCQSDKTTSEIFTDFAQYPLIYLEKCRRKFILAHERLQANELGIPTSYQYSSLNGPQSAPLTIPPNFVMEQHSSGDVRRVISAPLASQPPFMNLEIMDRRIVSSAEVSSNLVCQFNISYLSQAHFNNSTIRGGQHLYPGYSSHYKARNFSAESQKASNGRPNSYRGGHNNKFGHSNQHSQCMSSCFLCTLLSNQLL
jgi:hypothetical protein